MRYACVLVLAASMTSLIACRDMDAPASATGGGSVNAGPTPAAVAFAREQRRWRAARLADVTRPDGWTSLVGLHWVGRGPHYVGSAPDNGIRIAKGPPQLGMLELRKALDLVNLMGHMGVVGNRTSLSELAYGDSAMNHPPAKLPPP